MSKFLFKITNGFGDQYVVARDATTACKILESYYDKANWGLRTDRTPRHIEILAEACEFPRPLRRLWGVDDK